MLGSHCNSGCILWTWFLYLQRCSDLCQYLDKCNSLVVCNYKTKSIDNIVRNAFSVIHISIYSFIPILCLFLSNIIISITLFTTSRRIKIMTSQSNEKSDSKTTQVTLFLLGITTYFLITSLPISILYDYSNWYLSKPTTKQLNNLLKNPLLLQKYSQIQILH